MSEQRARYQRTFPGLVAALGVLLAVVLAFVIFRALVRDDLEKPVREVDYAGSLEFFREQANFPLLAPPALPAGWRATSVRFDPEPPQAWHLGVLTDDDRYVGLEQSHDTEDTMLDEHVDDNAAEGDQVVVAGQTWTSYTDSGGDYALVRREGGVTTLVYGSAGPEVVQAFAELLR